MNTRLALAGSGNFEQLLQHILIYGIGDESDAEGRTLLHYCVDQRAWSISDRLLQAGIPIDLPDGNYYTPLHYACKKPCAETVAFLLQRGANPMQSDSVGSTPLHFACFSGDVNIVTMLLRLGVDINRTCKFGWTPLHYASERGHEHIVELLLNHGAKIEEGKRGNNIQQGLSALDMASSESIRSKLEVGALSSLLNNISF